MDNPQEFYLFVIPNSNAPTHCPNTNLTFQSWKISQKSHQIINILKLRQRNAKLILTCTVALAAAQRHVAI